MSKTEAQKEAIKLAVEKLRTVDLATRCAALKLPAPKNGRIDLRAFGTDLELTTDTFELFIAKTGTEAKEADRILLLHLLLCDRPLAPSDELVPFRDFSGGAFYLEPFLSRTVRPLVKRYQNRVDELQTALTRFDFQLLELGDFSAKIHAAACLDVTLIYRLGNEEFPPQADLFFNKPVHHALGAEDAVVLASRICIGLL